MSDDEVSPPCPAVDDAVLVNANLVKEGLFLRRLLLLCKKPILFTVPSEISNQLRLGTNPTLFHRNSPPSAI